jgi:universal stress protein A
MANYKRLLVSVELIPKSDEELVKAGQELAAKYGAELYLVHAIEYMSSYGASYGVAVTAEMENFLLENAQKGIRELGSRMNIPEDHQILKIGFAKGVILNAADEIGADMIVVGSHGRHGFKILLGSTANAVLHGAKCDVLVVRFKG